MRQPLPILFIFIFTLSTHFLIAQAPPVFDWQKCFGGTSVDVPHKMIRSNDGGYIIAGSTASNNGNVTFNHGANDFWVIKTDSAGTLQWQKTYGGSGADFASSVIQLGNADIVVAGYTFSNNQQVTGYHGSSDFWLIRIDSIGNLLWQKTFGGSSSEICYSLALALDGGFVLAGSTASTNGNVTGNHGQKDFWIVKTDSAGNLLWQQTYGGSGIDECYVIKTLSDGSYIASGYTMSNDGQVSGNHGGKDYWVVKLDSIGNLLWQQCYGGTQNEVALTTLQMPSGNFLIGGYANSNDGDVTDNHGSSDFWIIQIDSSDGSLITEHTYGGSNSDIAYDMIPTADNGYIIAGGSTSNDYDVNGNNGIEDCWLAKTDSSGTLIWSETYGGSSSDRPASILQTADGGFIVANYTYSNNGDVSGQHGIADIWLFKLSCLTPVSSFSFPSDTICIHTLVNFTNASVHAANYEWRINDIPFSNNTNSSFQFLTTGTYKITLIGSTCYETDTLDQYITVIDYPHPSVTSSVPFICTGNSDTLSTSASGSYSWNNGATTSSIITNSGGVYTVTVSAYGCSSSASYTLNQYIYPSVNLGHDTTVCSGSLFMLHATPGYQNYYWQNGSTDSILPADTSGLYFVTVSNGFCVTSDSIIISVINSPVTSIVSSDSFLCAGNSATLAASGTGSFLWNNGSTSPSIVIDSGGIYSVTLTSNGCSASSSIAINQYAYPSIYLGNDTSLCSGSTITLHIPSGYQSYLWQDGSNDSLFTVNATGLYSVTAGNGYCIASDSIYITIVNIPSPVISSGSSYLCAGASTTLSASGSGSFLWNDGETNSSIVIDTGGIYTVTETLNGCSGNASFSISQYPNPVVNLGNDTSICSGSSITLYLPSGYQSYLWQDGSTDSLITVNTAGLYYVTADNGYCIASDSIYLTIVNIPNPSISSGSSYLCEGASAILSANGSGSFLWNDGETTSSIVIDSGGIYSVAETVNGCSGNASFSISQYPNPVVNLGNDTSICSGSAITLYIPSGYQSYLWQDGSSDTLYTVNTTGLYFVTVSNGFCNASDSIQIDTINCTLPSADFSAAETIVCPNSCINFTDHSQRAVAWYWYFQGAATDTSTMENPTDICYDSTGLYSVYLYVTAANGFSDTLQKINYIVVNGLPQQPVITVNGVSLSCSPASAYQWFFNSTVISGATAQNYNVTQAGYYRVMITDGDGCTAISDSVYCGITSVYNVEDNHHLNIFPNPTYGKIIISFSNPNSEKAEIMISDLTGELVYDGFLKTTNGKINETIDLEKLVSGVYFLRVKTGTEILVHKLVLER